MGMENHFNHIRWPPLNVTIFITHVRYCVTWATPMAVQDLYAFSTKALYRPKWCSMKPRLHFAYQWLDYDEHFTNHDRPAWCSSKHRPSKKAVTYDSGWQWWHAYIHMPILIKIYRVVQELISATLGRQMTIENTVQTIFDLRSSI